MLAEGVETYDEMSVTIRRGVDYIQGFYTAKPQKEIVPDIPDAVAEQMRMLNMCRPEIKRLMITSSMTVARNISI